MWCSALAWLPAEDSKRQRDPCGLLTALLVLLPECSKLKLGGLISSWGPSCTKTGLMATSFPALCLFLRILSLKRNTPEMLQNICLLLPPHLETLSLEGCVNLTLTDKPKMCLCDYWVRPGDHMHPTCLCTDSSCGFRKARRRLRPCARGAVFCNHALQVRNVL